MSVVAPALIPYGRHHIDEEDIEAVANLLRTGALTQGPAIDAFEAAVAAYVGARYAVATSSCTAGLHMAAAAAGVGPATTLITSPITFVASANCALYAGGRPAFADIDPHTINMSPRALVDALERSPDTRAVVPVHFAGLPCDMPSIKAAADAAGAVVIEDAAHALGATYSTGERVGSCTHSLMTLFSFHPVKAIAAGEGGMITTNDESVYRRLLRLRSHGINKLDDPFELPEQAFTDGVANPWYHEMQELGFHYRITDIQCTLALSQFQKIDRFIARRRALVKAYDEAFFSLRHCRPGQAAGRDTSGHHLYVLRINFKAAGIRRGDLMRALRARGIGTQVHYIPVPAQPHYRRLGLRPEGFPEASAYYQEALSIPLYYDLTDEQQQSVIAAITEHIG
jgi:perosamine synthetase